MSFNLRTNLVMDVEGIPLPGAKGSIETSAVEEIPLPKNTSAPQESHKQKTRPIKLIRKKLEELQQKKNSTSVSTSVVPTTTSVPTPAVMTEISQKPALPISVHVKTKLNEEANTNDAEDKTESSRLEKLERERQMKAEQAKVVDDLFKEFLTKKMLEIEQEKTRDREGNRQIEEESKDKKKSKKGKHKHKDKKKERESSSEKYQTSKHDEKGKKRKHRDKSEDRPEIDGRRDSGRKEHYRKSKKSKDSQMSEDDERNFSHEDKSKKSRTNENTKSESESRNYEKETVQSRKSDVLGLHFSEDGKRAQIDDITCTVGQNNDERFVQVTQDVSKGNENIDIDPMEPVEGEENFVPPNREPKQEAEEDQQETKTEILPQEPKKKLGIALKISDSSSAFIKSGEKWMDEETRKNSEEGQLSDSEKSEEKSSDDDFDFLSDSLGEADSNNDGSLEEGEIDTEGAKSKSKKKKKKHKKKKKKKNKNKEKGKEDKPLSRSRSRTPKSGRSPRSKSPSGFDRKSGVWRSRSRSRDKERLKRSRSNSRDRSRSKRSRSHSRDRDRSKRSRDDGRGHNTDRRHRRSSERQHKDDEKLRRDGRDWERRHSRRSRSLSRERRRRSRSPDDLRLTIDKARLRQIAIQNAMANAKSGQGPPVSLKPEMLAELRAGGKSVEELTDMCKRLAKKAEGGGEDLSSDYEVNNKPYESDEGEDGPFINHPFKVAKAPIMMNIKNATQLPVLTPAEKAAQGSALRLTFPVSSGSHHRAKESEWVPVEKEGIDPNTGGVTRTIAMAKQTEKVFEEVNKSIDVGSIVTERLRAVRKLQDNPHDVEALGKMFEANQQMTQWANSKYLPGAFTGTTGATVLSQQELTGDPKKQAWLRKNQLVNALPLQGGVGMLLLRKMGWKPGEGLGKNNEGPSEPLMLDVKMDRKGLYGEGEGPKKAPVAKMPKDLSGKHPVSALVELCNKRRWGSPNFQLVFEEGPSHKKNFLFKVKVNNTEYQPSVACNNKKAAKAMAATVCLQAMGLVPRDSAT
ncbi:protein SON isoform X1 [Lingula anatina]|uniref:Protein SON isoform X1 n=2 Tax=Lingula anatina TaxID=7574 RepID=A0A2R2MIG8_LINAN|nr:protein SON isoform X1 [Lingula anatina]|eukprot:XP_023929984.1 protein SON isoform X1 [Lingula anatina]